MRGAELTKRLLAIGRRQILEPEMVDLNALVAGTGDLLRRALFGGIEIRILLAGDLWRTTVDQSQLESALLDLAIYALDAMAEDAGLKV